MSKQLILGCFGCCFQLIVLTSCSVPTATTSTAIVLNHDRRSAGTFIDDQSMALKASLALVKNKSLWHNSHISTMSFNNKILLVGQTTSGGSKHMAEQIVSQVPEVKHVYNEIIISEPISFATRTRDTWLTTQVKAKLISNRDLGPNRVKVITENGIVYLMGILSAEEEQTAVNIASHVKGVRGVVKVIDSLSAN